MDENGLRAVALERRLTALESKVDNLAAMLERWMSSQDALSIATRMQTMQQFEAVVERVGELETSTAVTKDRWARHRADHETLSRRERGWDAVVGVLAAVASIFVSSNTT